MDRQRLFDEAVKQMERQGWRQSREPQPLAKYGPCRYVGQEGRHCAFYAAIKDYSPELETRSAGTLVEQCFDVLHEWARPAPSHPERTLDVMFVIRLQRAHDKGFSQTHMKQHFIALAKDFNMIHSLGV